MKRITTVLFAMCTLCTGCKNIFNLWKDDSIAVSVVGDFTSPLERNPDTSEVYRIMNLDNDSRIYSSMTMRYRCISDISMTPVQTISVPGVSMLLSSDMERIEKCRAFKQNLRHIFEEGQKNGSVPQTRSCIYSVLVNEAQAVMKIPASEHYLLIYSDLLDNDKNLNMYSKIVREQVEKRPLEVIKSMKSVADLGNVSGLRVIILYQSKQGDAETTEEMVKVSSKFYQKLFTSAGATCIFAPSLESANLNEAR